MIALLLKRHVPPLFPAMLPQYRNQPGCLANCISKLIWTKNNPTKAPVIFRWVCSLSHLTAWPRDCRRWPARQRGKGTGWSYLLWWLQSLQSVKLIRKPHVFWGPVTKFASFGKSLQSLLICSIVCEIVALQVILSGRGAFWRISKEMFFEIHRGAASVPAMAIQAIVSVCRKGVSHLMVEIYFF